MLGDEIVDLYFNIYITNQSNPPQYSHNILCMFISKFEPLNYAVLLLSPG